ncbi:MAG: hypothetical protein AAGA38_02990 [Pseudomonadota bacterium]
MEIAETEDKALESANSGDPTIQLKWNEDGEIGVEVKGGYEGMLEVAGCETVLSGVVRSLALLGSQWQCTDEAVSNFAVGFINTMQPRDATELLLLSQMAATHEATMMLARRLNRAETLQQQDGAERAFNKLARTFTTQMEALKRYRAKAQQTVRVERVTVEDGGQAIVGSVEARGVGSDRK